MDQQHLDEKLNAAANSALGRVIYTFILPTALVVVGWLGVRSINDLDATVASIEAASAKQTEAQIEIKGELKEIRAEMAGQVRLQNNVNAEMERANDRQDKELDWHARALRLKK